jgi:urease accessory protein
LSNRHLQSKFILLQQEFLMMRAALAFLLLVLFPVTAFAHVGVGDTSGWLHGFLHPIAGIDHVLAMVAVGLLAAQLGGRALWLVPATFVCVMASAGIMGMAGAKLPLVELGIGLSIIVLGLTIAVRLWLSTATAMALAGFFAIFHGYTHGAEMPETVSGLAYAAGFICATALLHAIGVGLRLMIGYLGPIYTRTGVEIGGAAIAIAGAGILVGIM